MRFIKVNKIILQSTCTALTISSLMFVSCDESKSNSRSRSNSRNIENTIPDRPVKTQEQIAAENRQYEKNTTQVKDKIEKKISKLSYKAISPPRIRLYQDIAETHTPVKKVKHNFKYDAQSNTITDSQEIEDKVFTMRIMFKKYSEYEITSVQLIDEANMKYWDLE